MNDETDNGPIRHRPATDTRSKAAKENAQRAAESRRIVGNQGRTEKGAKRNIGDQAVHAASHEGAVHEENMDREMDDLYDTEADNEVREWRRASALDAPPARPGYVNRFVRVRLGDARDMARWNAAQREGWRPVKASSVSSHSLPTTQLSNGLEVIGVEDLVLCEMPEKVFQQRQEFYRDKLDAQNQAIERQLREVSAASNVGSSGFGPIEQTRRSSVSVRQTPGRSRMNRGVAEDD